MRDRKREEPRVDQCTVGWRDIQQWLLRRIADLSARRGCDKLDEEFRAWHISLAAHVDRLKIPPAR
jgi:hypothetical protein